VQGAAGPDEQRVLALLIDWARARLGGQLHDADALDAKALGILGADAAAIGVLVAVHAAINSLWWIPTLALGVAGTFLLATIWPREYDIGPDPHAFYEQFGAAPFADAQRQMLADLLAATDRNEAKSPRKSTLLVVGFVILLLGLGGAVLVTLVR
jgi:hypothetical protein